MAKIIGKGKVFVFEPFSVSYRMLVKNVFINDLDHIIECFHLAAGDRSHEMRLEIDSSNTGHSHLVQGGASDA